MELGGISKSLPVFHDLRGSFGRVLEAALHGQKVAVANGPLYREDPATKLMDPFMRSASQTGWKIQCEDDLAPNHVLMLAQHLREQAATETYSKLPAGKRDELLTDWTRAGLVLEVASRRGIKVRGLGLVNVRWKLNSTVTTRFGAEALRLQGNISFNPLTIDKKDRGMIVPNGAGRSMVSIDFKAMDVWSMCAIVPDLAKKYEGQSDPHTVNARILLGEDASDEERDIIKKELFTHAYGGYSEIKAAIEEKFPELSVLRTGEHGDAARKIQTVSAMAFRAGLSEALPLLVYDDVRPVMAIHDELVLDVSDASREKVTAVCDAIERGAKRAIGQPYSVAAQWGADYAECKGPVV